MNVDTQNVINGLYVLCYVVGMISNHRIYCIENNFKCAV